MMRTTRALAGLVGVTLLAACATPLPVADPDAVPAAAPPAVSSAQVTDVLTRVGEALAEADAAASTELLATRLTGPAATIRAAQYVLAAAGDPDALTVVPATAQTVVAPTTDTWPRATTVITTAPADLRAPLLLTLVQTAPREPYRLWSWVRLFPGVQMPATAQPTVGSAPLPVDTDALAVAPAEVVARYVDVLTSGDASVHAAGFTADPLRAAIVAQRDGWAAAVTGNGTLTETYQALPDGPYAIATADGGAIVVGAIQTTTAITLVDSTITIGDQTSALLGGLTTVAGSLTLSWLSVVAFAVPPAGSTEPITVLGAEHAPVAASGS